MDKKKGIQCIAPFSLEIEEFLKTLRKANLRDTMLEAGDSLVAIKAFLGHSSIATTCIYAQVTPELAAKYLNERGRPLENAAIESRLQPLPQTLSFLYHT